MQDNCKCVRCLTLVRTRVVKTRARLPARFSMHVAIESSPELPRWWFIQIWGTLPPRELIATVDTCKPAGLHCFDVLTIMSLSSLWFLVYHPTYGQHSSLDRNVTMDVCSANIMLHHDVVICKSVWQRTESCPGSED